MPVCVSVCQYMLVCIGKCQKLSQLTSVYIIHHSAGKHDCGPLYTHYISLHYFHLDSSKVVQLVQFQFIILELNGKITGKISNAVRKIINFALKCASIVIRNCVK